MGDKRFYKYRKITAMESIINFIKSFFEKSERAKFREKVLSKDIDFTNVVSSSLLAKQVYDELKILIHPDRFQDPEVISKATEIFQEVHRNRGNYAQLILLKEKAYRELPISNLTSLTRNVKFKVSLQ